MSYREYLFILWWRELVVLLAGRPLVRPDDAGRPLVRLDDVVWLAGRPLVRPDDAGRPLVRLDDVVLLAGRPLVRPDFTFSFSTLPLGAGWGLCSLLVALPGDRFTTFAAPVTEWLRPLIFAILNRLPSHRCWFEPCSGHSETSQVLLAGGQVLFLGDLPFSPNLPIDSAQNEWKDLEVFKRRRCSGTLRASYRFSLVSARVQKHF